MALVSPKRRLRVWTEYLKIEHTFFSMPLVYAGALLAAPPLTFGTAALILLAATGARTAALGLNRILDREIDAKNPRTAGRALPSGRITLRAAVGCVAAASALYFLAAAAISPKCLLLSPLPLLVFAGYPLLKRVTRFAHLGVGVGLALGPVGGYYAVSLAFEEPVAILLLAVFTLFWAAGFDILYAVLDEVSDREQGVHSLPAAVGIRPAQRVAAGLHAAAFLALAAFHLAALPAFPGLPFLLLVGVLFIYQHRVRDRVDLAFFRVNAALGATVFLSVALSAASGAG